MESTSTHTLPCPACGRRANARLTWDHELRRPSVVSFVCDGECSARHQDVLNALQLMHAR